MGPELRKVADTIMSDVGMGEDQGKIDALEQYLEENLTAFFSGNQPGKWRQCGGPTETAGTHRSRWSSWGRETTMEEFGGGIGKWGALGEMRRAAVEEPHRDLNM
eukprot:COSAG05_NODE_2672_length_2779_cov_26.448228_2_plen_105_part_00